MDPNLLVCKITLGEGPLSLQIPEARSLNSRAGSRNVRERKRQREREGETERERKTKKEREREEGGERERKIDRQTDRQMDRQTLVDRWGEGGRILVVAE